MIKLKLEELNRISEADFKAIDKNDFVLVLDSVRSLNNVGSVFRTADAFLAEKIYLCGITGTPPHRDIHKTALGATDTVEWHHEADIALLLAALKQQGYMIVALEQTNESITLNKFKPQLNIKYAFVLGNEVDGVSNEALTLSNMCIEIPQFGTKHSLNVSVATGILVWDYISKINLLA